MTQAFCSTGKGISGKLDNSGGINPSGVNPIVWKGWAMLTNYHHFTDPAINCVKERFLSPIYRWRNRVSGGARSLFRLGKNKLAVWSLLVEIQQSFHRDLKTSFRQNKFICVHLFPKGATDPYFCRICGIFLEVSSSGPRRVQTLLLCLHFQQQESSPASNKWSGQGILRHPNFSIEAGTKYR